MIYIGMVIIVVAAEQRPLQVWPFPKPEPYVPAPGEQLVTCDRCGWKSYYTADRARRGLAGHKNWCKRSKSN